MDSSKSIKERLRVVVVGAGLAGLAAARSLTDRGCRVVVVDKSRGAGGRMSTRRHGDCRYDHGAQYFTVRDARFMRHVLAWQARGLVQRWDAKIAVLSADSIQMAGDSTERYVAVPAMNAICRELAAGLRDCRFDWQAASASYDGANWQVTSSDGKVVEGEILLLSTPPEQARALVKHHDVDKALHGFEMRPCWSLMVEMDRPLFAEWDAAFVNNGPLSWVSGQASRPHRPAADAWVLHAAYQWSNEHLDKRAEDICALMLDAARKLPGAQPFEVRHAAAHRWRYALAGNPLNEGVLWYPSKRLALAGDWCHGSRIEGAFLSGVLAARRILEAGPL